MSDEELRKRLETIQKQLIHNQVILMNVWASTTNLNMGEIIKMNDKIAENLEKEWKENFNE